MDSAVVDQWLMRRRLREVEDRLVLAESRLFSLLNRGASTASVDSGEENTRAVYPSFITEFPSKQCSLWGIIDYGNNYASLKQTMTFNKGKVRWNGIGVFLVASQQVVFDGGTSGSPQWAYVYGDKSGFQINATPDASEPQTDSGVIRVPLVSAYVDGLGTTASPYRLVISWRWHPMGDIIIGAEI